jgi:hypothetical protein
VRIGKILIQRVRRRVITSAHVNVRIVHDRMKTPLNPNSSTPRFVHALRAIPIQARWCPSSSHRTFKIAMCSFSILCLVCASVCINLWLTYSFMVCKATGGSAIKAVEVLMEHGVPEERMIFVNLVSITLVFLSCPSELPLSHRYLLRRGYITSVPNSLHCEWSVQLIMCWLVAYQSHPFA